MTEPIESGSAVVRAVTALAHASEGQLVDRELQEGVVDHRSTTRNPLEDGPRPVIRGGEDVHGERGRSASDRVEGGVEVIDREHWEQRAEDLLGEHLRGRVGLDQDRWKIPLDIQK